VLQVRHRFASRATPLTRDTLGRTKELRMSEEILRIHCNECGRETNHAIRSSYSFTTHTYEEQLDATLEEETTFQICQCLGCDQLCVRETAEHEAYGPMVPRFYPPRLARRIPQWKKDLPKEIRDIVEEVYAALQSGSSCLATIGARTIVDLLILDKVGDIGSFGQKLAELERQGFVGRNNREFVAAVLDAGSAAAHRGVAPNHGDLNRVMDIVESLLQSVYVLGDAANRLRESTPARLARSKASPNPKQN
jgi:Domain of unknown function (DUF4145)